MQLSRTKDDIKYRIRIRPEYLQGGGKVPYNGTPAFKQEAEDRKLPPSLRYPELQQPGIRQQIGILPAVFHFHFHLQPFSKSSSQKFYHLNYVKSLKQFIGNTCGYHAIFNIREAVRLIKSQNINVKNKIHSNPAFWRHKLAIKRYLTKFALKNKMKVGHWPWKAKNLEHGDFERTYFQILNQDKRILQISYKRALTFGKNFLFPEMESNEDFQIEMTEFMMQFHNVIHSVDSLANKQKKIDRFRNGNVKNKHYILAFMMGMTSHWVALLAHKINGRIEFTFFDSRNIDSLSWTDERIQAYTLEHAKKRSLLGKPHWSKFKFKTCAQTIKDIQTAISILINCMLGNQTLLVYNISREIQLLSWSFDDHLPPSLKEKTCEDFQLNLLKMTKEEKSNIYIKIVNNWYFCYKSTLARVFFTGGKSIKMFERKIITTMRQLFLKCLFLFRQCGDGNFQIGQLEQNIIIMLKKIDKAMGTIEQEYVGRNKGGCEIF